MPDLHNLLTEAQSANMVLMWRVHERSQTLTNTRTIPYADRYRAHTGLWETPVEHLQRAAEDEAKRASEPAADV